MAPTAVTTLVVIPAVVVLALPMTNVAMTESTLKSSYKLHMATKRKLIMVLLTTSAAETRTIVSLCFAAALPTVAPAGQALTVKLFTAFPSAATRSLTIEQINVNHWYTVDDPKDTEHHGRTYMVFNKTDKMVRLLIDGGKAAGKLKHPKFLKEVPAPRNV